jgi:hypothetical protein
VYSRPSSTTTPPLPKEQSDMSRNIFPLKIIEIFEEFRFSVSCTY